MRPLYLAIFLTLIIPISCQKFSWNNPFDKDCPKELFTPSNLTVVQEGLKVKLTWEQQNTQVSGFKVERTESGGLSSFIASLDKSEISYLDESVKAGKKYTYTIYAVAGENKSNTIQSEITVQVIKPNAPSGLTATVVTPTSVQLAWVDNSSNETGFKVERKPTNGVFAEIGSVAAGVIGYIDNSAIANTSYVYRVYSYNLSGSSTAYSNEVNALTVVLPTITTTAITAITTTTAASGGTITNDGGGGILARGICWSTLESPTIANSKTSNGMVPGSFTSQLSNLAENTVYYVRAYVSNILGTVYGNEQRFTTLPRDTIDKTFLPYVDFNGTKTYVQIGITGLVNEIYGKSFSVESWILSDKVSNVTQHVYGTGYHWNGAIGAFRVALLNGRIQFNVGNYSGYAISCEFPDDKIWHHFAFTHDNENKISRIYIDGKLKAQSQNLGTENMVNGTISVESFGANLDTGITTPNEFFEGAIRKMRVSNGVVYNGDFTPSKIYIADSNTMAFWELNEGEGNIINGNKSNYGGLLLDGLWIK